MRKNKTYTVSEIKKDPTLLYKNLPFQITRNGKAIADVVKPRSEWRVCEVCKENTQNIIQFQNEKGIWKTLILCDKCKKKHL